MTLDEIKETARRLGGCGKIREVETWDDAADLLFSPQGQEFFVNAGYPDSRAIRAMSRETEGFCFNKSLDEENVERICIAGIGRHVLSYELPMDECPVVMLQSTNAVINARNYSVVKVVTSGDCNVIYNTDSTSIILH